MGKNQEIERKFLVVSDAFKEEAVKKQEIAQGYLSKDEARTVRVRIKDDKAFLTIKSDAKENSIARFEWEREIDPSDAQELLKLCLPGIIVKTRYIIPTDNNRKWEVDVFHSGKLEGKVLAELELESENEPYERPAWLGAEVTGQPEYYNMNM